MQTLFDFQADASRPLWVAITDVVMGGESRGEATHRGIAVSYGAPFATAAGEWIIVRVGLDSLAPTMRGTALDGPPFDPCAIREVGLLIADGRAGRFSLEVDWIVVE